jgi:hypothetical protein
VLRRPGNEQAQARQAQARATHLGDTEAGEPGSTLDEAEAGAASGSGGGRGRGEPGSGGAASLDPEAVPDPDAATWSKQSRPPDPEAWRLGEERKKSDLLREAQRGTASDDVRRR